MPAMKTIRRHDRRGSPPLRREPDDKRAGEAAEHCERWQHEHEMPDAVVHRRPQRDRGGERQQGGEGDQEKNRAPVEGATPCEGRKQGAHRAAKSQDRQDHRQLERE